MPDQKTQIFLIENVKQARPLWFPSTCTTNVETLAKLLVFLLDNVRGQKGSLPVPDTRFHTMTNNGSPKSSKATGQSLVFQHHTPYKTKREFQLSYIDDVT